MCVLTVSQPVIDEHGDLSVSIDGYRLMAGEKYTILELGWAYYIAQDKLPPEWLELYGETRPADGDRPDLMSDSNGFATSHPVLVALAIRAWDQRNGYERPDILVLPAMIEAVTEVASREIRNGFNQSFAGSVPGLQNWNLDGTRIKRLKA